MEFAGEHPFLTGFLALTIFGAGAESVRYISQYKPEIQHEQIIGGPAEEKFIEYGGQKYFSKIDGIPVEENYQTRE